MELGDLLAPDGIIPSLEADNKKNALQVLSGHAATATGLDAHTIYSALIQRESLGSTGIGRGIAIPHVKLDRLSGTVAFFAQLTSPIDFESTDQEPVDLLFLLLAPDHAGADHLKALARISRLVREPDTAKRLRTEKDVAALKVILTQPATSHAA